MSTFCATHLPKCVLEERFEQYSVLWLSRRTLKLIKSAIRQNIWGIVRVCIPFPIERLVSWNVWIFWIFVRFCPFCPQPSHLTRIPDSWPWPLQRAWKDIFKNTLFKLFKLLNDLSILVNCHAIWLPQYSISISTKFNPLSLLNKLTKSAPESRFSSKTWCKLLATQYNAKFFNCHPICPFT